MDELKRPHDKYFKETLGQIENARSFLENYLPQGIAKSLDLTTLQVEKGSFIASDLKDYYSDILYRVKFKGKDCRIYVLVEHKSYPETWISLQLLRYMLEIWEREANILKHREKKKKGRKALCPSIIRDEGENLFEVDDAKGEKPKEPDLPQKLPMILPVVLHHGEHGWTVNKNFTDIIDYDEMLAKWTPNFEYFLCDLARLEDEEIIGIEALQVAFYCLKYSRSEELEEKLVMIFQILARCPSGLMQNILIAATIYLVHVTKLPAEKIAKIAEKTISGEGGLTVITTAKKLRQEGEEIGIKKGEEIGIKKGEEIGIKKGEEIGIKKGFELALEIKFGEEGLAMMPQIRAISDIEKLMRLQAEVKKARDLNEIRCAMAELGL